MFVYAKNYVGKRPNKVLSRSDFYIRSLPSEITKLYIFADNCFFKIKTGISLHMYLYANSWLDKIHVFYPLPGHSRMPCDRTLIESERREERMTKLLCPPDGLN